MLVQDVPQFGVYHENEYKLAKIIGIDKNFRFTYKLPRSQDGVYNMVMHGLLGMKINQRCIVNIEVVTGFDAQCLGLHVPKKMEIVQLLHMSEGAMCLSPDTGKFRLSMPYVSFTLKVSSGNRKWNFEVILLSEVKIELPIERYSWVRLGMPLIDDIGSKFVEEIGKDCCIWRYTQFLAKYYS